MMRHRLDSLSDFARQGYNLRFTCQACGHVVDANAVLMMAKLHGRKIGLSIGAIERRAKCSNCGERKAHVSRVLAEF